MPKDPGQRPSEEIIARAYDALEEDDLEQAIDLAREAISQDPDDVEGYYIAGLSLFEIGEYARARDYLREAYARGPDDPLIGTYYGAARFVLGEEREAEALLAEAVRADPELTDARYWLSMVIERQARYTEADEQLAECTRLDPERFPRPFRIGKTELERDLEEVIRDLPERITAALRDVPIVIEDLPPRDMLSDGEHLAPDILGLFVGTSLSEASVFQPAPTPNVVYLFKRNLERVSSSREELLDEARVTLVHEIGHYLGLDEDDLLERGLD
jgi:predicted Zn-dependent protease with MMP-like domain